MLPLLIRVGTETHACRLSDGDHHVDGLALFKSLSAALYTISFQTDLPFYLLNTTPRPDVYRHNKQILDIQNFKVACLLTPKHGQDKIPIITEKVVVDKYICSITEIAKHVSFSSDSVPYELKQCM